MKLCYPCSFKEESIYIPTYIYSVLLLKGEIKLDETNLGNYFKALANNRQEQRIDSCSDLYVLLNYMFTFLLTVIGNSP